MAGEQACEIAPDGGGLRLPRIRQKRRAPRRVFDELTPISVDRIDLIHGYLKAEREDLTTQQLKVLATLMKENAYG